MKQLTPAVILVLGTLLTGAAVTTGFVIALPGAFNWRGLSVEFAIGVGLGLLMFGPIAAAEKFRAPILSWLQRDRFRLRHRVPFIIAMALGYWFASIRHHTFDTLEFVAMAFLFFGAVFGMMVAAAIKTGVAKQL